MPAAALPTAIDAERAFAADAQRRGQWTAFRATATEEAVMFVPQPVNAQAFLKDKADPPQPLKWWPASSFVSCDGNLAVNHGPWHNRQQWRRDLHHRLATPRRGLALDL